MIDKYLKPTEKTTFSFADSKDHIPYHFPGKKVLIIQQGENKIALSRHQIKKLPEFVDKWDVT